MSDIAGTRWTKRFHGAAASRAILSTAASFVSITAGYVLLGQLWPQLAPNLPVWPPSGVALALVLVLGRNALSGIAIGSFAAFVLTGQSFIFALALSFGNALSAIACAAALTRLTNREDRFQTPARLLALAILCFLLGALISSGFAIAGSLAERPLATSELWPIWFSWWLTDAAGSLMTAPLIVLWSARISFSALTETLVVVLLSVAAAFTAFADPADLPITAPFVGSLFSNYAIFLMALPLTWAALRGDPRMAASGAFAFIVAAAWLGGLQQSDGRVLLLLLSICLTVPSTMLAAALATRRAAEQRLLDTKCDLERQIREADLSLGFARHQFKALIEDVADHFIFLVDAAGRVASWNETAQRITGYRDEDVIGKPFAIFYRADERRAGEATATLQSAIQQDKHHFEGWRVKKDGTPFFATGTVSRLQNPDGNLLGFSIVIRDATERRQAQEKLVEAREQLAMAQKMEAIGKLTGGIAHDFNNLLMIIGGNAHIFKRLLDPKLPRAIDAIQTAAKRGEKLTRQLLTFSRSQHLSPAVVDLTSAIQNLRTMIESSLRGNIVYEEDLGTAPIFSKVDVAELELAIVNLAVNARDAMPNGGSFSIVVSSAGTHPAPGLESKTGFAAIEVSDTGTGIPPALLSKIFDPFFTTKEVGRGTGLGLSQVYGFAHQAGGTVQARSEVGRGTTITLYLPLCAANEIETPAPRKPAQKGPTVLVVDDSPDVAEVTSSLFEQLGYQTVFRDSAEAALDYLNRGGPANLVFSDIVMPGSIDGLGLANEVQVRYPKLPVILTTGYSDAAQAVPKSMHVMRKPFDAEALTSAVQKVLETEPA